MTSLNVSFIILYFRENLDNIPTDAEELSFGNSVYKITFENRERPVFGHKYWFFLQDAVENVPEYVVRWDNFVQYVFHFTAFLFITVFFFPRFFPLAMWAVLFLLYHTFPHGARFVRVGCFCVSHVIWVLHHAVVHHHFIECSIF